MVLQKKRGAMNRKKIIAIIPARGKSKGIPLKNIVMLSGKPLIAYTIEAAKKSGIFDKIVVSSEDKKIQAVAVRYGAELVKRPEGLARDTTPTEPVLFNALKQLEDSEGYKPDIIFLLQPTSPLRSYSDIRAAYRKFIREKMDSLLSVAKNSEFLWSQKNKKFLPLNYDYRCRPRRQDARNQFRENGAIYITKYSIFVKHKNRLGGKIGCYIMDEKRSFDIDSLSDLTVVRDVLQAAASVERKRFT
jgi:CMP-N,N'-diacetyllegionaminic acid synthase